MEINYLAAVHLYSALGYQDKKQVLSAIQQVHSIKNQIESKARELGHSQRCQNAIPECGGKCCKWHFPKKINRSDFLIAIVDLSIADRCKLEAQLITTGTSPYQCPLLLPNGCFLSFKNRPLICTNAYPCTMDRIYWEYLQRMKGRLTAIIQPLEVLFQS